MVLGCFLVCLSLLIFLLLRFFSVLFTLHQPCQFSVELSNIFSFSAKLKVSSGVFSFSVGLQDAVVVIELPTVLIVY